MNDHTRGGRVLAPRAVPPHPAPSPTPPPAPPPHPRRVFLGSWEDEILDRAAGLSYYFSFALFPTLLFLTALLGLLPLPNLLGQLMDYADRKIGRASWRER